jgi:hypothetical protein
MSIGERNTGEDVPFVNHVKSLGVIFDKRITWRLHIKMIEAMAFRIFNTVYSLLKKMSDYALTLK